MKRIVACLLAVCLLVLPSCSGQPKKSAMYPVNGAYNLTPQEYIDAVNAIVEKQGDSRYKTIPDFEESGKAISVWGINIEVKIDTNDAGKITQIKYEWTITSLEVATAATFLVGLTIGMLSSSSDNADTIIDQLDMLATGYSSYETSCTMDGSDYDFFCFGGGKYNWLTITPATTE